MGEIVWCSDRLKAQLFITSLSILVALMAFITTTPTLWKISERFLDGFPKQPSSSEDEF